MHTRGTSNISFNSLKCKLERKIYIDDNYIHLVIVHLKHILFISTITEILPAAFMYDR